MCGLEKITTKGTEVTQIDVIDLFGRLTEMKVADQHAYFDLSGYLDECTLLTEVIWVKDGNLSDE